jgi:hypothetical protein
MIRSKIPLLLVSVFFCTIAPICDACSQDEHEEFYRMLRTVCDILEGKKPELAETYIPQRARLICGPRFEDLRTAVAGDVAGISLADTSYHGVMVEAQTNPSEDMGFMILKTRKSDTTQVRFHTVVFMKDSVGQYKIRVWHAGGM